MAQNASLHTPISSFIMIEFFSRVRFVLGMGRSKGRGKSDACSLRGHCSWNGVVGAGTTSCLEQLRDDLFSRVSLPWHSSVLHQAISHTSGRTTSKGADQYRVRARILSLREQHAGGGAEDQCEAQHVRSGRAIAKNDHRTNHSDHRIN